VIQSYVVLEVKLKDILGGKKTIFEVYTRLKDVDADEMTVVVDIS